MATSIINLMYYSAEDIFYYTDVLEIDEQYRYPFVEFFGDVINSVNLSNPVHNIGLEYVTTSDDEGNIVSGEVQTVNIGNIGDPIGYLNRDTGDAAIPFNQGMRLSNIPSAQVLTRYEPNTTYEFKIRVQSTRYTFTALGSEMVTYKDLVDVIEANTPAKVTYVAPTRNPLASHYLLLKSHILGKPAGTADNGGVVGTLSVTSSIEIEVFANNDADALAPFAGRNGLSDASQNDFADVSLYFSEPTGSDILTLVPDDDSTVFQFAVGTHKALTVRGFQARTYQDLVDTINEFGLCKAIYRMDGVQKHQIYLYNPLPKSPTIDSTTTASDVVDSQIITRNATLRGQLESYATISSAVVIEDFSKLTTNGNGILHELRSAIAGGYNLMTTLQNSKRANGSYWTEFVPIYNDQKTTKQVSALQEDQADLVEAIDLDYEGIDNDVKRKAALDLGLIVSLGGGALFGGIPAVRAVLIDEAIKRIPGLLLNFKDNLFPNSIPNEAAPAAVEAEVSEIIDDGVDPDALKADGSINDASKLTTAQKSKLLPPDRTTVG